MKRSWIILIVVGLVLILVYSSVRNSYNTMVSRQEMVSGQWAQVENVYQRRTDLIPNLVSTVRGYADFEQQTLTQVIEARSKATSIDIDAGELTPQAMERFEAAQAGLTSALSRLLVTVERYPELKANQNFLELQAQLEGRSLQPFDPGGNYLLIFNVGGGKGVFHKSGICFNGSLAFWIKDYIDRKFIREFQP